MPWTVTHIVDQVNKRTENRAADKIDMRMEFFLALDEFANEQHFYWRKRRGQFTTQVNVATYDLSTPAGGNVQDYAQMEDAVLINADGVTVAHPIVPIFDPKAQIAAILNQTADTPAAAFIDTNISLTTFRLQAPANVAQLLLYWYWAIPMVTDTDQEAIPLVPGYLHWGLIYALERRIYEFLYGQDDQRWVTSNARYGQFLAVAANMPDWAARKAVHAAAPRGSAIQAHT